MLTMGTYPFATSSNTVASAAATLHRPSVGKLINYVLGITKLTLLELAKVLFQQSLKMILGKYLEREEKNLVLLQVEKGDVDGLTEF